jgi:multidrug efflux pump subunit AcrB
LVASLPDTELENFVTTIGSAGNSRHMEDQATGTHLAQIHVFLRPEASKDRRKTKVIINSLREQAQKLQGFDKISFEELRPGPPVGKPVAVKIRGDNYETLTTLSERFQDYLKTLKGVTDITDDYTVGKEELRVLIDEEKATRLFLTTRDIANAVKYAFDGGVATQIKTTDEEIDVVVQFRDELHKTFDAFNCIFVPNKFGKLIPLTKVAELKPQAGVSAIRHLDRKRVITVSAYVDEAVMTSAEVNRLLQETFKDASSDYLDVTITYGGELEDTQESMRSFLMAFIIGMLVVFLILASTFSSLIQPLIILTSIPLAFIGVILTFFLHGKPFGFFAIMGGVGLAGVAVNDAIVMVDFINELRKKGMSRRESIIQAGKLRLRPVLLTTITTVAGLLPTAYGWGGSDPFIKPMALALAWGLMFATGSTLIVIPCIYAILDDIKVRVSAFTKKEIDILTHHAQIKKRNA